MKILKAKIFESPTGTTYPVGKTLIIPPNSIAVQCGDGKFIDIEKMKLEGKNETTSEEFSRGFPDFIGALLK